MDPSGRSETIQAGQSLGKFYLVRLIGEGGTSRIFKALQHPINRIVALKIPSFSEPGNILSPDEFLSEATLMARLDHPKVVRIYDFGVHEDKAFICMEYVEGWNLAEWIEARGPMSAAAALALGAQTLDALTHAHAHDVLHLDLSPANVLIGRHGAVKLSDFGMAGKRLRSSEGRIVGTPAFLSPEHVAGLPGTRQSDLFSFGSLLYFAALGEPLFDPGPGNTRVTQAIREIEAARSRPPEDRLRRLPAPLMGIVKSALNGAPGSEIYAALRAAYRAACGETDPEETLRRELGLDGAHAGAPSETPLPEGEAFRDLYLRMREEGRHREAVSLLERALKRQPESPMLRELLAHAPSRQKSGAATMEVGADPAGAGSAATVPSRAEPRPSGRAARPAMRLAWIALGSLAVTFAALALTRANRGAASTPDLGKSGPTPGTERPALRPQPSVTIPADEAHPVVATVPAPPAPGAPAEGAGLPDAARAQAMRTPSRSANAPRRPRPPAVALSGPAGTRVSVDDTAEWVSPGPKGGWPVAPGLVNITLKPPGQGRAITSSIFVSEDTLYVLSLDGDGGFSVSRRRR